MKKTVQVPYDIYIAVNYTLYIAMVCCRNIASNPNTDIKVVYELMDALHEVPNILNRWGTYDNNIDKLRDYFGYFDHHKWKEYKSLFVVPDLVQIFNEKMKEGEIRTKGKRKKDKKQKTEGKDSD